MAAGLGESGQLPAVLMSMELKSFLNGFRHGEVLLFSQQLLYEKLNVS